jgi:VWFA-related protein
MSAEMLPWVSSLLGKATVVLVAAVFAERVLRHRSASARHAVWSVALLGLLVLPLLSALLPSWELPVLPARPAGVAAIPATPPTRAPQADESISLAKASPRVASAARSEAAVPLATVARPRHWSAWALLVWSLGATIGLLRLAAGAWVARRLARDATPVTDADWTALVAEVSRALRLARPVQVLASSDVALPVVWGYRVPKVLLPPDAGEWPIERRRAFLLHELAHVLRHDCLVLTLASVAHALYWPHPLVWWSMRRLRSEAEHACDDRVLSAGTRGPDYADHLLDVARSLHEARSPMVVMGIAERSNLEDRLLALLDPHLRRGAVGRRAVATAAAVGLSVVAMVAMLQPVARAAVAQVIAATTARTTAAPPVDASSVEMPVAPARESAEPRTERRAPHIVVPVVDDEADIAPLEEPEWVLEARVAQPLDEPASAAVVAPPAPEPAPATVVRLGVDLVQLDAVVTDKNGHQVTDLTPAEFEVREDGKLQTVSHVRYVVADPRATSAGSPAADAADVRRVITIVVDDLGLSFEAMSHIRDGLRKLVQERVGPHDRVAVITTGKPEGLRRRLTNDPSELTAAVDALRYDPWNRAGATSADTKFLRSARGLLPSEDGVGSSSGPTMGEARSQYLGGKSLAALEDVIVEMRGLPGRKSLLFFSDRLSLQGSGSPPWIDPALEDGVQRVTDAASRAAVVIYGIGSSAGVHPGLETADQPGQGSARLADARRNGLQRRYSDFDGVGRLADATGGFLFYGGQHIDSVLDVIMEDLRGYYLVAYTPGDDAFRPNKKGQREFNKVDVRVVRRGVKVRSRAGFYGVTDQETMPERRSEVSTTR